MDVKVSRREKRYQPDGVVEVLVDNVCDLYPIFADDPRFAGAEIFTGADPSDVIMDIEILDDPREELLDRALFAVMKQRGLDPIDLSDGNQWSEAVLGEVIAPVLIQQVHSAVSSEDVGVKVTEGVIENGIRKNLIFKVELTNAV